MSLITSIFVVTDIPIIASIMEQIHILWWELLLTIECAAKHVVGGLGGWVRGGILVDVIINLKIRR